MSDGSNIVTIINKYVLWRLYTAQEKDREEKDWFTFEAWLNTSEDKDNLFNELKPFVDEYGEKIDWHECSHDEATPIPCVIAEEYKRGD